MGLKNKIFVAFLLAVIGVQGFVIYGLLSAEQQPAQPQINPVELKENSAQVYFCPEDNCEEHILETLENAKKWIEYNKLNIDSFKLYKCNGYNLENIKYKSFQFIF